MSSASKLLACLVVLLAGTLAFASMPPLRVCVDGANLPFSNQQEQGFEDVLARMVAHDLHRDIQFLWLPQLASHARKALRADNCDLLMGTTAPSDLMVLSTPYYRSSFVFVSRRDRDLRVSSLADPSLAKYRIAVQVIGGGNLPPAEELARRGLVRNIIGYSMYGDASSTNPTAVLIRALETGDVDLAVAWGPMAGYYAKQSSVPLQITPIRSDGASTPMSFDVSMGVRRGDTMMLEQVNQIIVRRQKEIRGLLTSYGVPLMGVSQIRAGLR